MRAQCCCFCCSLHTPHLWNFLPTPTSGPVQPRPARGPAGASAIVTQPPRLDWKAVASPRSRPQTQTQPNPPRYANPAGLGHGWAVEFDWESGVGVAACGRARCPTFCAFPSNSLDPRPRAASAVGSVLALRKGQTSGAGYCAPTRRGPTRSLSILVDLSATGCVVSISRWEARGARWSEAAWRSAAQCRDGPRGALTAPSLGGRLATGRAKAVPREGAHRLIELSAPPRRDAPPASLFRFRRPNARAVRTACQKAVPSPCPPKSTLRPGVGPAAPRRHATAMPPPTGPDTPVGMTGARWRRGVGQRRRSR